MKNTTRFKLNAYMSVLAEINKIDLSALNSKFTIEPSVSQTLESKIQESSAFLQAINIMPVSEQSGDRLGLGIGTTIAGTTDTTQKEREPTDPTYIDGDGYKCTQTNFDTALPYSKLDMWAKFSDFQVRIRDSHRFTLADRDSYTGVIASWLHTREPAKKPVAKVKRRRRKTTAKKKKEPEAKQGDYLIGTDENVLVLSRTYANRGNAERAAKMQWERLQRGVATFSIQLAKGRAELYTEMPVKVSGFKQQVDAGEWIITTLTHSLSADSGFTTSIELEVKIDSLEME